MGLGVTTRWVYTVCLAIPVPKGAGPTPETRPDPERDVGGARHVMPQNWNSRHNATLHGRKMRFVRWLRAVANEELLRALPMTAMASDLVSLAGGRSTGR